MASQPTIWRRNRDEVRAKQQKIRDANEAYRQQFIDAAAADEAKAAEAAEAAKSAAQSKAAEQRAQTQQHPQLKQNRR